MGVGVGEALSAECVALSASQHVRCKLCQLSLSLNLFKLTCHALCVASLVSVSPPLTQLLIECLSNKLCEAFGVQRANEPAITFVLVDRALPRGGTHSSSNAEARGPSCARHQRQPRATVAGETRLQTAMRKRSPQSRRPIASAPAPLRGARQQTTLARQNAATEARSPPPKQRQPNQR